VKPFGDIERECVLAEDDLFIVAKDKYPLSPGHSLIIVKRVVAQFIALREEDNSPLFLSPKSNAPHTLIAGSTGSGKSVLMQNIILGIACTNTPEQAKIILIDPKLCVDYFAFDGLPHSDVK